MSYRSRLYNHRNAQSPEAVNDKPFFSKQHDRSEKNNKGAFFQAKLAINKPGDQYEQEADNVAHAVVNNNNAAPAMQQKKISSVQRLATTREEEKVSTNDQRMDRDKEKPFQRMPAEGEKDKLKGIQKMEEPEKDKKKGIQKKDDAMKEEDKKKAIAVQTKQDGTAAGTASPQVTSKIESAAGKGHALPKHTLQEMSTSFGADFSNVRIHKDSEAVALNKELNAEAFTHGNDIYFNTGKYNPESSEGKFLLAHELTHVVQQNSSIQTKKIQRTIGDGHDLNSEAFSGDPELEAAFDGEKIFKKDVKPGTSVNSVSSVKKIQQALVGLGFSLPKYGVDGSYGDETVSAVKKYQSRKKLKFTEIDGEVGKQTIALLDSDLPAKKGNDKGTSELPTAETVDTQKQGKLDDDGNVKEKPEVKEKPVDKKEIPVTLVKPEDPERLFSFTFEIDAKNDWLLRHKEPFKLSFCDSAVIQLGGKVNVGVKMDKSGRFVALSEPELDVNLVPAFCSSNPGITAQINLLKFTILKNILEADLVGILGLPDGWATGLGAVPISGGFQGKAQWTPFTSGDSFVRNAKIGIFLQVTGQQGVPDQTNGWRVGGGLFIGHDFDFGPTK
jgi:hypothetical protein